MTFLEELHRQRWDDHRYYHHNRVNQLLHLLSASCFVVSYYLIFVDPVAAVMVGWLLAMVLRQIGHFFFEPKSYDAVNGATHEYKESVKVGYNLRRKVVLLSVWIAVPIMMGFQSGLVWAIKILTDPFHDIKIYHRAPLHILKGDMYDDMTDWYREVSFNDDQLPSR